jgi:hypothetical protein
VSDATRACLTAYNEISKHIGLQSIDDDNKTTDNQAESGQEDIGVEAAESSEEIRTYQTSRLDRSSTASTSTVKRALTTPNTQERMVKRSKAGDAGALLERIALSVSSDAEAERNEERGMQRFYSLQIQNLQETIRIREATIEGLREKHEKVVQSLRQELTQLQEKREAVTVAHNLELQREREKRDDMRDKLADVNNQLAKNQIKIERYENKVDRLTMQLHAYGSPSTH